MKHLRRRLGRLNAVTLAAIALISFFASWGILRRPLEAWADRRTPPVFLSIEVLDEIHPDALQGHEVWISQMKLNKTESLQALFEDSSGSGFEFRAASEYGYTNDVILATDGVGSRIIFPFNKENKDASVVFWKQSLSGIVRVSIEQDGKTLDAKKLDLFSEDAGQYEVYEPNIVIDRPKGFDAVRIVSIGIATLILFMLISLLLSGLIKEECEGEHTRNTE